VQKILCLESATITNKMNTIGKIGSLFYVLTFLLSLFEFHTYSMFILVVISGFNIIMLLFNVTVPIFNSKRHDIPIKSTEIQKKPLTLQQMKIYSIIFTGGFLLLFGLPWFYAVARYASLQYGSFGEWSFYLWPAIIFILLYVLFIIKEPSYILIKLFRVISKIIFIFTTVNILLNVSDTRHLIVWFFITSIGQYLIGGTYLSDGYYTIPHFYIFLWTLLIFSALNIFITRDAKSSFKLKELRSKFQEIKTASKAFLIKLKELKDPSMRKKTPNAITQKIQKRPIESAVFLLLLASSGLFISSIENYGQDIIIQKHPTITTRLNFWAAGTYIPPEYIEVIKSFNIKYNTTTTLYTFGNDFNYQHNQQFLIDIPEAKYPFQLWNGTNIYLNATETLDYMQTLIDAKIEFFQAIHKIESIYPALSVLNSTTINATFRERFNIIFQGFMFDIEAGGNYGAFNRTLNEEKHRDKATIVKRVHEAGKKVGYTTVAYTIGDWLDGDNDVSTLYRIFDFNPSSINPEFQDFYYDRYNWMIYRTDQPGRNLNPYFSYLHFKEAKSYMDKVQKRYPELKIDSDTNFGISFGWPKKQIENVVHSFILQKLLFTNDKREAHFLHFYA
jgi:hypothetical protein